MSSPGTHEPNEEGFAGEGTTPEVSDDERTDPAEDVAVPGDDLTEAASEALSDPPDATTERETLDPWTPERRATQMH